MTGRPDGDAGTGGPGQQPTVVKRRVPRWFLLVILAPTIAVAIAVVMRHDAPNLRVVLALAVVVAALNLMFLVWYLGQGAVLDGDRLVARWLPGGEDLSASQFRALSITCYGWWYQVIAQLEDGETCGVGPRTSQSDADRILGQLTEWLTHQGVRLGGGPTDHQEPGQGPPPPLSWTSSAPRGLVIATAVLCLATVALALTALWWPMPWWCWATAALGVVMGILSARRLRLREVEVIGDELVVTMGRRRRTTPARDVVRVVQLSSQGKSHLCVERAGRPELNLPDEPEELLVRKGRALQAWARSRGGGTGSPERFVGTRRWRTLPVMLGWGAWCAGLLAGLSRTSDVPVLGIWLSLAFGLSSALAREPVVRDFSRD